MTKATLIVDLGFGDSGKGTLADYICRRDGATAVVRYNGGAQAAHNVVTPEGVHHTFAQFGSGTFAGAKTHLGPLMMLNPVSFLKEAGALSDKGIIDPLSLVSVDERTLITTPFQQATNRLREIARGQDKHGSCGMGVGETMWDYVDFKTSVHAGDLRDRDHLISVLRRMRSHKREQVAELAKALDLQDPEVKAELAILDDPHVLEATADVYQIFFERVRVAGPDHLRTLLAEGPVVFEGAQGVLLDEWFGFHPYTTWSTTTLENAERMLKEASYTGPVERLGVIRGYQTRHGAGPFPTENASLTETLPDLHNGNGRWQENFRVGWLDLVLLRYALDIVSLNGPAVEKLAVTGLDRMPFRSDWPVAIDYDIPTKRSWPDMDEEDSADLFAAGRILPGVKDDLERQESLTHCLERAQPRYQDVPLESYLDFVASELRLPVVIESWGPTADDKRERRTSTQSAPAAICSR